MIEKPIFDARAARHYDEGMASRVPGYMLAQELAGAVLSVALPGAARILVIGAGTGSEILYLASLNTEWRFTAVDISEDMLDVARTRLADAGLLTRVEFICAPMQVTTGLPEHDAALAQLVAQFVRPGDKSGFYHAIAQALAPDALLLSLDYRPTLAPNFESLRQWAMQAGAQSSVVSMMEARIRQDWHIPEEADLMTLWQGAGLKPGVHYSQALAYIGTVLRRQSKEI